MAEIARMPEPGGVLPVECLGQSRHLGRIEDAPDDREAIAPITFDIVRIIGDGAETHRHDDRLPNSSASIYKLYQISFLETPPLYGGAVEPRSTSSGAITRRTGAVSWPAIRFSRSSAA